MSTHPDTEGSARPLSVALFTDNYGPGPSGILYATQALEGELVRHGVRTLVVAPATDATSPHADAPGRSELRLPSVRVPGAPIRVASGRGFERALAQIERNPPDVVHAQGLGNVGLLGVWAARRCGVPLVVTWHTDFEAYAEHYASFTPFLDAYMRLLRLNVAGTPRPTRRPSPSDGDRTRWRRPRQVSRLALLDVAADMLRTADLVTVPSGKTAGRVRELAPDARVRVSPNGLDALPPGPAIPASAGPRILYVGRIAPEKGLPLLLDAFGWVREEIPDAELMIVGDWHTAAPALRRRLRAEERRREGVVLAGMVPRDQLRPYYESADVFAFPSLTDTQALVLHEAAHAGLPIVSVDPELDLVIDDGVNGRFARPTPESLARALVRMLRSLRDPAFARAAHGRSRALASRWSVASQGAKMVGIYEEMAATRPGTPQRSAAPTRP